LVQIIFRRSEREITDIEFHRHNGPFPGGCNRSFESVGLREMMAAKARDRTFKKEQLLKF
jgi:hypothetical protein